MLKFMGAMFFGLLAMGAAAYFALRPKDQRGSDFETARKLAGQGIDSAKRYLNSLFHSEPSAEVA